MFGPLLLSMRLEPGEWRRFASDFAHRYRKVSDQTTTRQIAEALAELTAQVEAWS